MGTLTPVFPKGLTGISPDFSAALAGRQKGAITDPAPAMPAACKNSLRERLDFMMGISDSLRKCFGFKKDGAKRHQQIPGPDRFYEVFILPTNSN
jgi:hypothetical protein